MLLLGYDAYDVERVQAEHKLAVPGRHDIRGRVLEPLDEEKVRAAVGEMVGADRVEAIAISGMGSVKNPEHEIAAARIVAEESGLPVVCGHELSMELGAIRRATTAYVNARLLPIVVGLMHALESELRASGVTAPIMVVRSDGTLMSIADALTHPIHTVLSGPAASAVGALYLSGLRDALVVDIGGTTTDILFAEGGNIRTSEGQSSVNGLEVNAPMVLTHTTGFGGDSCIRRDPWGKLTIGPERVIPICVLAHGREEIIADLKAGLNGTYSSICQPVEYFTKGWARPSGVLLPGEKKVLDALSGGPKSSQDLAKACDCVHASLLPIHRLERWGSIMRSGLTPSDILHFLGRFESWSAEAARLGVTLYAQDMGISTDEFCNRLLGTISDRLSREVLSASLGADSGPSGDGHRSLADALLTG